MAIHPYDRNRVILKPDANGDDYINASWITGNDMIAAQGPLANTVVHFLQMIVEQNIEAIVMLTKLSETSVKGTAKEIHAMLFKK